MTIRKIALLTCSLAPLSLFANPATDDAVLLDRVVVSVQKREESPVQVPRSMTVHDQWQLRQAQATSVDDLATLGPNMSSSQANGINTLTLRGIGGGGRNIGFDPRVGVYIDGVYAGQAAGLSQSLFGIEQAVVLRGPQGSLFGRNSVAGAVVLTSEAAPNAFEGTLRLGAGSHNARLFEGHAGGALNDRLRGVIGVNQETRDGVFTNAFDGGKLDDRDRFAARGQLVFDATERDQIKLFADYSKIDEHNFVGYADTTFFSLPISPDAQVPNFNQTPRLTAELMGASLHWIRKDDAGRTWTAIAGHRKTEQERRNDTDYSAFDLVNVTYQDDYRINSVEARVANDNASASRYVLGVYAAREQAQTLRRVDIGQDLLAPIRVPGAPAPLPFGAVYGLRSGLGALATGRVDTDIAAAFGQWDYDFADRWTSHLGGRLSQEQKDVRYSLDGRNSGRMSIANINDFNDGRRETHFSPNAGLSFKVNDRHTAYANYSRGYKSGGWNLDFLNASQAASGFSFEDERVDNVEIGIKGEGGRWSYDVSAFEAKIDDFQVFQFVSLGNGGSVLALRNAAEAKSRGVEAQGRFKVSRNFSVHGSAGFLNASFSDFPNGGTGGANLAGNQLPESPRRTASLGSRFTWAGAGGQWSIDAEAAYRGKSYAGVDNSANQVLASRTVLDAQIGYMHQSGAWSARVWARNLTNSDADMYRTRDFFGHDVRKQIDPRSVVVEVALNF